MSYAAPVPAIPPMATAPSVEGDPDPTVGSIRPVCPVRANNASRWLIAVHAGAGYHSATLESQYRQLCADACRAAGQILQAARERGAERLPGTRVPGNLEGASLQGVHLEGAQEGSSAYTSTAPTDAMPGTEQAPDATVEALCAAIAVLEDSPLTNAGHFTFCPHLCFSLLVYPINE